MNDDTEDFELQDWLLKEKKKMAKKTKKLTAVDPRDEFNAAMAKLTGWQEKLQAFMEENEDVLEKFGELTMDVDNAKEMVKLKARELSVTGETTTLINNDLFLITVQGKQDTEYDLNLMLSVLDTELQTAMEQGIVTPTVNSKQLAIMLESGDLTVEQLNGFSTKTKATPAVSIKVK